MSGGRAPPTWAERRRLTMLATATISTSPTARIRVRVVIPPSRFAGRISAPIMADLLLTEQECRLDSEHATGQQIAGRECCQRETDRKRTKRGGARRGAFSICRTWETGARRRRTVTCAAQTGRRGGTVGP